MWPATSAGKQFVLGLEAVGLRFAVPSSSTGITTLKRTRTSSRRGGTPRFHYLVHGSLEGRDPGPFFSTRTYLAKRPDLAEAGVNALVHYETHTRERPLATVAGVDRGDDQEVRGG